MIIYSYISATEKGGSRSVREITSASNWLGVKGRRDCHSCPASECGINSSRNPDYLKLFFLDPRSPIKHFEDRFRGDDELRLKSRMNNFTLIPKVLKGTIMTVE
jgi:hypothetical protein